MNISAIDAAIKNMDLQASETARQNFAREVASHYTEHKIWFRVQGVPDVLTVTVAQEHAFDVWGALSETCEMLTLSPKPAR
jgi:hypothetical protein